MLSDAIVAPGRISRVTSTWVGHVESVGQANPDNMPESDRYAYSYSDLCELEQANWLWLLMPEPPLISAGAFLEFGYALARGINVCISGPGQMASIFTSMADVRFREDTEAVEFFKKIS
jgi:hypothetical protein